MVGKRAVACMMPLLTLALLVPLAIVSWQQVPGSKSSPEPTTADENAPTPIPDIIPRDALLPRTADEWASQYDSKDDFERSRGDHVIRDRGSSR